MCDQELRLERVRMALAEAGYPGAALWWTTEGAHRTPTVVIDSAIPTEVIWRACVVCNETAYCLDCFCSNATGGDFIEVCEHPISLL